MLLQQANLSGGTTNLSWDFANLTDGNDYHFEWHWSAQSNGDWYSEDFTSNGSSIEWNLTVGSWDCWVEVHGYLYNTSDGNWDHVMERHFHFEVPGCLALDLSLESEQDGQWDWAEDLYNGTNQMRWNITAIDATTSGGYNYTLEWYVYRNGDMTDYDYVQWSGSDFMSLVDDADGTVHWNLTIDEFDTCELEVQGSLYASDPAEGGWVHVAGLGEWYDFPCDEYGDYDPVIVSAYQNGTWVGDVKRRRIEHCAAYAHSPGFDPALGLASRTQSGARHDFGDALAFRLGSGFRHGARRVPGFRRCCNGWLDRP